MRHRETVRTATSPRAGWWRLPDGLVQGPRCVLWLAALLSLVVRLPGLVLQVPPAALPVTVGVAVGCIAV